MANRCLTLFTSLMVVRLRLIALTRFGETRASTVNMASRTPNPRDNLCPIFKLPGIARSPLMSMQTEVSEVNNSYSAQRTLHVTNLQNY